MGFVWKCWLNPEKPNGFADHYTVFKWLFHWEYTQHVQTNPCRGILWISPTQMLHVWNIYLHFPQQIAQM